MREVLSHYYVEINTVTGRMEQVQVGNMTIQSENLNALHLAVYHSNLEVVKILCENIPILDLEFAGKIPQSSGLVNQSETSLDADIDRTDTAHRPELMIRNIEEI